MHRELLIRAADHGPTYLTWRRLDDPGYVEYAVLEPTALAGALAGLERALPHPLLGETGGAPMHRALVEEAFADPERETALAALLGAAVLPPALGSRLADLDPASPIRLRVTPSPRLARVPWELLALPDGRRLIEVADVVHDAPAILHAGRGRLPLAWDRVSAAPIGYLIDPSAPGLDSVLDVSATMELQCWIGDLSSAGRVEADDERVAVRGQAGRRWLGRRLRDEPWSRLLYFGHISAADDGESSSAAIHLADRGDVRGFARPSRDHRPLVALDLFLGAAPDDEHCGPEPVYDRAPGYAVWPMPPRVILIGCESGGDYRHPEPFGLVLACLNAGAEIVTATRWTLPADRAFHDLPSVDGETWPTTDTMRDVDGCHDLADPVAGLAQWQRGRLAAWTRGDGIQDTPLLWAALATHVAPARP